MSQEFDMVADDLFGAESYGPPRRGGKRGEGKKRNGSGGKTAYYAGAATVCATGTAVSNALWRSPVKTPHVYAAAVVSSVVTMAGCTLAGDAIPRPRD